MPDGRQLPYAEKIVGRILRADPSISALVADRVGTRPFTIYPYVMVRRIGGIPPVSGQRDRANLQIDVRADTEMVAQQLTATVQQVLACLPRSPAAQQPDAVITRTVQVLGVQDLPEPPDDKPRRVFGFEVDLRSPYPA